MLVMFQLSSSRVVYFFFWAQLTLVAQLLNAVAVIEPTVREEKPGKVRYWSRAALFCPSLLLQRISRKKIAKRGRHAKKTFPPLEW